MRDELKPCPFCGEPDGEKVTHESRKFHVIYCASCGATGPVPVASTGDTAESAWNTRQAQAQGSEDLASWLRWVAGELVKRDTQGGTFAQGVAQSLCGRAYILEYVAHKKDAAHAQAGEGSNG